ncbi:hypothetical protein [Williamsia sp. 1135]|uniref:hypothetical protein n=1 Tax=Williamsia sp. 1135 TaxID=1889262 RepID=UPI000A119722|nr:hypothetical protein [Williamsia sp. 1135]ORM28690.1 hypothetical protein BFL43_20700 [Williamsia sp. 1135]
MTGLRASRPSVLATAVVCVALSSAACTGSDDPPASISTSTSTTTVTVPSPNPSADPATRTSAVASEVPGFSRRLTQSLQTMLNEQPGSVGIAIGPVNGTTPAQLFGDLPTEVSWSTIKVPLALAALREVGAVAQPDINLAIMNSDNAAAERLWEMLGTPTEAAAAVTDVLRSAGDTTTVVQSQNVRAGFTAFGQTEWSLMEQARFASQLPCMPDSAGVLALMREVGGTQQWGVQSIEGTAVKGGWGPQPDTEGNYLVRQMAVIPVESGDVVVTMATTPDNGTFEDGTAVLDDVGAWITENLDELPAGQC